MAQKTNPIIYQLGKTKLWKSQYFEKTSQDSKNYSYSDTEIRKYITKFFKDNGLIVYNCKIYYFDNNLVHIVVSYMLTLKAAALAGILTKKQHIRFKKRLRSQPRGFNKKTCY
jgi:hypothetical protein